MLAATRREYFYNNTYLFKTVSKVVRVTKLDEQLYSVVLDKTIFHPQGGGQPSDTGFIQSPSSTFTVSSLQDDKRIIQHIGTFSSLPFSINDSVELSINQEQRKLNARLHSAGHLLDVAVAKVYPSLKPSKGNHFPDSPCVEYVGTIPAEERAGVQEKLQVEMDALSQSGMKITVVVDENEVRSVFYGDFGGKCGGTHCTSAEEIGAVKIGKIGKGSKGCVKIRYSLL